MLSYSASKDYVLKSWPDGYQLYEHNQPGPNGVRHDLYLYGASSSPYIQPTARNLISPHKALHSSKSSGLPRNSCPTPSGSSKTKRSTTPTVTANTPAETLEKPLAHPPPPPPPLSPQARAPPATHANRPSNNRNDSKSPAIQANRTPLSGELLSLRSAPRHRTMSCRRTGIRTYSR